MAAEHHKTHFRSRIRRRWVSLLSLLGFFLFAGVTVFFVSVPSQGGLVGQKAPEIEFRLPNGAQARLSQFRGKGVLLNFWANWCEPCVDEMPALRSLEEALRGDLVVLAFNIDGMDAVNEPLPLSSETMPRTLIYDFEFNQLSPYKVRSIPISALLDRKGILKKLYLGPRNWGSAPVIQTIQQNIDS